MQIHTHSSPGKDRKHQHSQTRIAVVKGNHPGYNCPYQGPDQFAGKFCKIVFSPGQQRHKAQHQHHDKRQRHIGVHVEFSGNLRSFVEHSGDKRCRCPHACYDSGKTKDDHGTNKTKFSGKIAEGSSLIRDGDLPDPSYKKPQGDGNEYEHEKDQPAGDAQILKRMNREISKNARAGKKGTVNDEKK